MNSLKPSMAVFILASLCWNLSLGQKSLSPGFQESASKDSVKSLTSDEKFPLEYKLQNIRNIKSEFKEWEAQTDFELKIATDPLQAPVEKLPSDRDILLSSQGIDEKPETETLETEKLPIGPEEEVLVEQQIPVDPTEAKEEAEEPEEIVETIGEEGEAEVIQVETFAVEEPIEKEVPAIGEKEKNEEMDTAKEELSGEATPIIVEEIGEAQPVEYLEEGPTETSPIEAEPETQVLEVEPIEGETVEVEIVEEKPAEAEKEPLEEEEIMDLPSEEIEPGAKEIIGENTGMEEQEMTKEEEIFDVNPGEEIVVDYGEEVQPSRLPNQRPIGKRGLFPRTVIKINPTRIFMVGGLNAAIEKTLSFRTSLTLGINVVGSDKTSSFISNRFAEDVPTMVDLSEMSYQGYDLGLEYRIYGGRTNPSPDGVFLGIFARTGKYTYAVPIALAYSGSDTTTVSNWGPTVSTTSLGINIGIQKILAERISVGIFIGTGIVWGKIDGSLENNDFLEMTTSEREQFSLELNEAFETQLMERPRLEGSDIYFNATDGGIGSSGKVKAKIGRAGLNVGIAF